MTDLTLALNEVAETSDLQAQFDLLRPFRDAILRPEGGSEEAIAIAIRKLIWDRHFAPSVKAGTAKVKEEEMQAACWALALRKTAELRNLLDRSVVQQADDIHQNGFELVLGYDDIAHLLNDMLSGATSRTETYDLTALIEKVLPELRERNIATDKMLSFAINPSKARRALPAFRHALDNLEGEEQEQVLEALMDAVADPETSARELTFISDEYLGKKVDRKPPSPSTIYYVKPEETWLKIKMTGSMRDQEVRLRSIMYALKSLVDEPSPQGIDVLAFELTELIRKV